MGSLSFPRLQLGSNRNVLPTQTDSSNCGTATTATVAIILRDCFGSLERFEAYEEAFNLTRMVPSLDSSKGQYVCNLTKSILQPLPLDLQGKLFLPTLRAEWLTVFDRLAFLLHEKIPKKPPTVDYNTVKSMIKWPCDLKSAGKPNTEVADDSAAVHSLMTLASISTQKAHANITTNPSIIPKVKKATVAMSRKKPPVLPTTRNRIDDVVLGSAGKTPTLLERILTPPTKRQRVLDKRHAQDGDTIASLTQPLMVPSATKQDSNPVKNRSQTISTTNNLPKTTPFVPFQDSSSDDDDETAGTSVQDKPVTNWPKTEDMWIDMVNLELNRKTKEKKSYKNHSLGCRRNCKHQKKGQKRQYQLIQLSQRWSCNPFINRYQTSMQKDMKEKIAETARRKASLAVFSY
jgi:hypothetical protein